VPNNAEAAYYYNYFHCCLTASFYVNLLKIYGAQFTNNVKIFIKYLFNIMHGVYEVRRRCR